MEYKKLEIVTIHPTRIGEDRIRSITAAHRRIKSVLCLLLIGGNLVVSSTLRGEDVPSGPKVILGGDPGPPATKAPAPAPGNAPNTGRPAPLGTSPNVLIVDAIESMPSGGTYRANATAVAALQKSIQAVKSQLLIEPNRATPSFCSGATYLIFLSVLDRLHRDGQLAMDEATLRALLVQEHQPDGAGVWGRWNANGPGTARLFHETGLGHNFTSFEEARPGDFLKIFWNNEIGALEAGHSVVYLASVTKPEGQFVRYWSSNQPAGFGIAEIPRQRIKRVLFSRLEHPEQISRVTVIPARDAYLASMLKRPSSAEEMARMVGLPNTELARAPIVAAASPAPENRLSNPNKPASGPRDAPAASPTPLPANPEASKGSWFGRLFRKQASERP